MSEPDYYKILGTSRNASQSEIADAYRKLAKKYHPDLNPHESDAAKKFKLCAKAYEILRDPAKRSRYDADIVLSERDQEWQETQHRQESQTPKPTEQKRSQKRAHSRQAQHRRREEDARKRRQDEARKRRQSEQKRKQVKSRNRSQKRGQSQVPSEPPQRKPGEWYWDKEKEEWQQWQQAGTKMSFMKKVVRFLCWAAIAVLLLVSFVIWR